jgi:cytochrome c oxidase assembly protein subunit 15
LLSLRPVARAAELTLGYTIFVILFGAVVRITGSGAGCGQHWPTCNGEIVHLPRRLETLIELTHRVTSGGALIAVLAFATVAVLNTTAGDRLRLAAYAAVLLMVFEALIGAGLVLFRLVAGDASGARAIVMPAHLISTYALVAVLTLAARWSRGGARSGAAAVTAPPGESAAPGSTLLALAGLAIVVVAATGAVTALGDTLYPPTAASLAGRVTEDHGAAANFLQRLRVLHPVLAVCAAAFVAHVALACGKHRELRVVAPRRAVLAFAGVQVLAGGLNVVLSAPGWLQVVHLGLALGLWIAFVSLAEAARAPALG